MATAQARYGLVWVSQIGQGGQPIYASSMSGGEVTTDSKSEYNGGSLVPEITTSPPQTSDVVLTYRYDPVRDSAILSQLKRLVGSDKFTVNILDTDGQLKPIPGVSARVYPKAVLKGVASPEYDANGDVARTMVLTFAVGSEA